MKHTILVFMFLILTSAATAQTETDWHTLVTESSSVVTAVEGAKEIDVSMAKTLLDRGVKFVDVRRTRKWKKGHIPGAFSLRYPSETTLMEIVDKNEEVVFYCSGSGCSASPEACAKALTWGYEKVYYFAKGLPGWESAGHPIEKAK